MPAKLIRVTQQPFGTSGPTGDFGAFGSKAANPSSPIFTQNPITIQSLPEFSDGWGSAIVGNYEPPMEDMNGLFLLTFYQIGYILQMGLPEYDSGTNYFIGSRCQFGGVSYVSLQNNNLGNEPDTNPSSWQCSSSNVFGGNVASASSITLPNIGNSFKITGTTTINNITVQTAGIVVELIFTGALTVNTGGNILLNSGSFVTVANATLVLISDGTNWFELSRSPITVPTGFGSWSSLSAGVIYQAATDGIVNAVNPNVGSSGSLFGYTDSSSSPGTLRAADSIYGAAGSGFAHISMPVKKNDYWIVVNGLNTSVNVYFLPLGI